MAIPEPVFDLLRQVMQRPDFAGLLWEPLFREWHVGLYNGGRYSTGHLKRDWHVAGRLSGALAQALAAPLTPAPRPLAPSSPRGDAAPEAKEG